MDDLGRLSINQLTTRDQWSLADAIDGYARAGVRAMAVWWEKLRETTPTAAAAQLRDAGMAVSGYCVAGQMTARDDAAWRAEIDENRRMIEEAATIGASCLVAIGGGLAAGERDIAYARARTLEGFAEVLPFARAADVRIALEPLHPMVTATRSVLCTMRQANDWCDVLNDPLCGIAVDTYNVWWDPELETELERAGSRVLAYHVSDWLTHTRDVRFDRGMPGDGVIDLKRFAALIDATGYQGFHEVEILSRYWWSRDPNDVVDIVKQRFAAVM